MRGVEGSNVSATTKIQWTDRTWNPTRGCSVISPGCHNCYAMKQAHRFSGQGKPYEGLTKQTKAGPQWTGKVVTVEDALLKPLSWRKPARVFVNSMSDLFHEDVPDAFIDKVFAVMALAPRHAFQILTKRPARMLEYIGAPGLVGDINGRSWRIREAGHALNVKIGGDVNFALPLSNVWLGTSVENQQYADQRIGDLIRTPAAVRFISAEPLLGPVDLEQWLRCESCRHSWRFHTSGGMCQGTADGIECHCCMIREPSLDWVIVGGESGPGARPCALEWIEAIVKQCRASSVPVFVKQLGAFVVSEDRSLTPEEQIGFGRDMTNPLSKWVWRAGLTDRKGGAPEEWPVDLRVRQFPENL